MRAQARLAEFRKVKRYPCGVGLACRGLMSRESAPAGGQGGGRDSRPLRGLGRAPISARRAGPAPGSRGQGSRVGFGATPQRLAPCVSFNFNACDFGSGASPVRGPGGESPRRGPGAELPGGVWGNAPRGGRAGPGMGTARRGAPFSDKEKESAPPLALKIFFFKKNFSPVFCRGPPGRSRVAGVSWSG